MEYIRQGVNKSVLKVGVLETENMAKRNDLSNFNKGLTVMTRSKHIPNNRTCGVFQYAVVSIKQKWSKEGYPVTGRTGSWVPKAQCSHRSVTVTQIAEK